jgi:YesN/AraC family two-component response regulator
MEKIKILIADDHKIFRDGIKSLLDKEKGIEVVAEAANGNEVLELVKNFEVNLVIMDIDMGTPNGI